MMLPRAVRSLLTDRSRRSGVGRPWRWSAADCWPWPWQPAGLLADVPAGFAFDVFRKGDAYRHAHAIQFASSGEGWR